MQYVYIPSLRTLLGKPREKPSHSARIVSAVLIPWEPGQQGVDIALSDGRRVAIPLSVSHEAPSVSDEQGDHSE